MRRAKVQDLSGKEDAIILIAGIVLAVTLGMVEATGKILRLSGEFLDRCTGLHGLSGKCRPGVLTMTVKTFPGLLIGEGSGLRRCIILRFCLRLSECWGADHGFSVYLWVELITKMLGLLFGISLAGRSGLAFALTGAFAIVIYLYTILLAEPYLESLYKDEYRLFKLRTARWIGIPRNR